MENFELPPIAPPTHKTKSIQAMEWRRLFLPNEPFFIDELRDNINSLGYQVAGSAVSLDDEAEAIGMSITYRMFLRTCFKAFDEATSAGNGIDIDDELTYPSLVCFEALGILAAGRKEVIIQGVPL
jgi:hypothetical protein